MICPKCGDTTAMRAPRDAYCDLFFVVTRPYVCLGCGAIFEAPYGVAGYVVCAVIVVVGSVVAVAAGFAIVRELLTGA